MVWGCIAHDRRSTLVVVRGTLTGQRYADDIFWPHVGHFLNCLPGAIFQQDNAHPHTARVVKTSYAKFRLWHGWPIPDLSPIENVWDQLKRQLSLCHSAPDLEAAVQDLWAHLPQDNISRLINSMQEHLAACIAAGVGPTRYWFCSVFESVHTLYLFNCLDFEIK